MRLIRSTAIISSLTLISRILGLIRDVFIARFLGAGVISDAFFTAFKLPNLFRRMFAEGAFNAAFVPLYARRLEEEGADSADAFAREAMAALLVLVAAIVIVFELTMPWTLSLIGYGLDRHIDPETGIRPYYLAVLYAQITMPYLIFMSLTALFSGILNTRHYFALAAGVLMTVNVFMIATLAVTGQMGWPPERLALALAVAVSLSGIVQMGLVIWGCRRAGVRIGLQRPRLTPGVRRLFVLGVPGLISAGITQINLIVSHSIATLKSGAASWLTYADRLYQLPLGMIGIAMGVALLPALSRRLRSGDEEGARLSFNRALEIAAFLTLPATMALIIMPDFLLAGLFQRGAFTAETTQQTAKALTLFACGLPAFVLLKVMTPAFFAREDTKTPMIFAALSAAINIVLGITFFFTIGFEGLALATSIAAWVNVVCLTYSLRKRGDFMPDGRLILRIPRILCACLIMGAVLYVIVPYGQAMLTGRVLHDFPALILIASIGFVIYVISAFLFRAFDMSDIKNSFMRTE